jgi:hypothetical protein
MVPSGDGTRYRVEPNNPTVLTRLFSERNYRIPPKALKRQTLKIERSGYIYSAPSAYRGLCM